MPPSIRFTFCGQQAKCQTSRPPGISYPLHLTRFKGGVFSEISTMFGAAQVNQVYRSGHEHSLEMLNATLLSIAIAFQSSKLSAALIWRGRSERSPDFGLRTMDETRDASQYFRHSNVEGQGPPQAGQGLSTMFLTGSSTAAVNLYTQKKMYIPFR